MPPGASSPAWSTRKRPKGNEQLAAQEVCDGILALMDENLIPSESIGAPKVFDYKMKGAYKRYLCRVRHTRCQEAGADE